MTEIDNLWMSMEQGLPQTRGIASLAKVRVQVGPRSGGRFCLIAERNFLGGGRRNRVRNSARFERSRMKIGVLTYTIVTIVLVTTLPTFSQSSGGGGGGSADGSS